MLSVGRCSDRLAARALLPFVAGMVLAYLLNPVVSRIER
jgi:predicted PurR-regulated permease PerM